MEETERIPGKRKSLSKAQRFGIFGRDQFTCRYCGRTPPTVKLVLDHVVPVAEGGTSDDANLITSCESCNQGKGAKRLEALPSADTRRMAQENLEQIDLAKLAAKADKARRAIRKLVAAYYQDCGGGKTLTAGNLTGLCNLVSEFGPDRVFGWITTALNHARSQPWGSDSFIKYVYGIARNVREQEGRTQ